MRELAPAKRADGHFYEGPNGDTMIYGMRGNPFSESDIDEGVVTTTSFGYAMLANQGQIFDTGGYTGNWSEHTDLAKDGKMAVLHQKELILNETDTENILKAVELVREFATEMKSGFTSSIMDMISNIKPSKNEDISEVQQEVHITAEFPNATSAKDIEDALLSLNDRSIQYAFKIR